MAFAAITESRDFDGKDVEGTAHLVATTRVARASPSMSSAIMTKFLLILMTFFQDGKKVVDRADFLVGDEDMGLLDSNSIFAGSVTK